jgi:hypothetical protein
MSTIREQMRLNLDIEKTKQDADNGPGKKPS